MEAGVLLGLLFFNAEQCETLLFSAPLEFV